MNQHRTPWWKIPVELEWFTPEHGYHTKKRKRRLPPGARLQAHTHAVIAIDFFATRASARPLKPSNAALVQYEYAPWKRQMSYQKLIPITTGTVRHPNGIQNSGRDQLILFCERNLVYANPSPMLCTTQRGLR